MRIVTVDDHPLTRHGVADLLRKTFRDCVVWGTSRNADAVPLVLRVKPDLILLDLHLPDPPTTAQTCRTLRARGVTVPMIILTAYDQEGQIDECLAAGANGCLLKDDAPASVAAALRRALDGECVFDPRVRAALAERRDPQPAGTAPKLTSREVEILGLVAAGVSNRDLAKQLCVAESTVKWHLRRLMDKLSADSRWQAVVAARERGLL